MVSLDSSPLAQPADESPRAEEQLIQREWSRRLHSALARLPEKSRTVIMAHSFEERSLDEIGQRPGLSKSWVSRIHSQAIAALRHHLLGGGEGLFEPM